MLSRQKIKRKYGHVGSYAIWQRIDDTQKAKFGMGDISHFDNIDELNINKEIKELKVYPKDKKVL